MVRIQAGVGMYRLTEHTAGLVEWAFDSTLPVVANPRPVGPWQDINLFRLWWPSQLRAFLPVFDELRRDTGLYAAVHVNPDLWAEMPLQDGVLGSMRIKLAELAAYGGKAIEWPTTEEELLKAAGVLVERRMQVRTASDIRPIEQLYPYERARDSMQTVPIDMRTPGSAGK